MPDFSNAMNELIIKNLKKTYPNGVRALDNLTLEIRNGMFGLLGPNGAGKSSLMSTLAGLQPADDGSILFNGQDVTRNPVVLKRQLGYLPQDFGVYPKVSAYDLLMHIAVLKGLKDKKQRHEQVCALLQQTNLYAQRHKEVHTFSGGMRQRFGIAQALLGDPQLIIADEPTAGLDPQERNRFNNLLSEIGEDKIVILSTHLVEDISNLCTTMAVMQGGRIIAHGKPADFTGTLQGKLWEQMIARKDSAIFQQQYQLISSQLAAGKLRIRIFSESDPGNDFQPAVPELEDAYFNLLNPSCPL